MEKEDGRIGHRILKPETAKGLAFEAVTARRVFSLKRYFRGEPETAAAEAPTRGRARGERDCRGRLAVAACGRAQPAIPAGHAELGGPAGAQRGLATLDSASPAEQRGLVAGLCAAADGGSRDAISQNTPAMP